MWPGFRVRREAAPRNDRVSFSRRCSIILEQALDVVELELRAERLAEAAAKFLEDAAGTLGVDFARHLHGGVVAVIAPAQRPAQWVGFLLRPRRTHAARLAGAGPLTAGATEERLAAFGFTDVERTRAAVRELADGLTRRSKLLQQILPLVLEWLSTTPDPDLGLLQLRRLAEGPARSASLATTSAREIVCERRNPSAICNAVRTPQAPLAMSKENVPCASLWGSSGLAPMSSWIIAASAGSPKLRSR